MEILERKGLIGSIKYIKDEEGNIEPIEINCGITDEGECYKDDWDCGDVIYVSEYGAIDFNNKKESGITFENVAWTKESWLDWIRQELNWSNNEEMNFDERFIEYIAKCIWEECGWESLTTRLDIMLEDCDFDAEYSYWKELDY